VRVEHQRPQGFARVPGWRRNLAHRRLQHGPDVFPGLGGDRDHVIDRHAQQIRNLLGHHIRLSRRQVDLVDDRDDLQIVLQSHVEVGERLSLNALRRVHNQDGPFAGLQRPADFIGEIDVAGRIDQIHLVVLAAFGSIQHPHSRSLDRHAALALQVHVIEHLLLHLTLRHRAGELQQAVGQRALAMINVGDDAEVADLLLVHARLASQPGHPTP